MDQRGANYTVSSKSSRWSKTFLDFMIDTSLTNAQTVWSLKKGVDPRKSDSYQFRKTVASGLVLPFMRER